MEHKYKEFALRKSSEDAGEISGYFPRMIVSLTAMAML